MYYKYEINSFIFLGNQWHDKNSCINRPDHSFLNPHTK
jgi:hypothetical protein